MNAANDEQNESDENATIGPEAFVEAGERDIHRIGGAAVENLRLKSREAKLKVPGISVLKSATASEASQQMRTAFPRAHDLHEEAKTVGSTAEEMIRSVGFDIIHAASKSLPNHYRIIHPDGVSGFDDGNLNRLAQVFVDTTGH